jgi:hypothetical protein
VTTGFEGYKLSELERIAYDTQNFLAQEVLTRCATTTMEDEYQTEAAAKRRTQWVREEAA